MFRKNAETNQPLSNRTLTVPNVLSFLRIILITPFVVLFLRRMYIPAAIVIIISGLTDFVDGYIARKFHQESELGKILDPLADKLTLIAVGLCLIIIEPFVLPLMIILVIKDTLMIIGGTDVIKRGVIPPKSEWYGKLGTAMFYVTVVVIVLMEITGYENRVVSLILLAVTAVIMIFSLIKYAKMYIDIKKKLSESDEENNLTAQVTKTSESYRKGE